MTAQTTGLTEERLSITEELAAVYVGLARPVKLFGSCISTCMCTR
jgi:hypothetical protein